MAEGRPGALGGFLLLGDPSGGWRVSFGFTELQSAPVEYPATRPVPAHLSLLKGCGHLLPGSLSPPGTSLRPSGNVELDTSRMLGVLLPCGQNPQPDEPARPQLSRTFPTLHAVHPWSHTVSALLTTALPVHLCPCDALSYPAAHGHTPSVPTVLPLPSGPEPWLFRLPLPQLHPVGFWVSPGLPWNPPPVRSEAGSDTFVSRAPRQGCRLTFTANTPNTQTPEHPAGADSACWEATGPGTALPLLSQSSAESVLQESPI